MNDIDKYEGTWKFYGMDYWKRRYEGGCEADTNLIHDAPLLLAEINRHRPPKVDGKYMAWSDSHLNHDRRTWIEQVMEGITDVGYWTWVNWQLQYADDFANENGEMIE